MRLFKTKYQAFSNEYLWYNVAPGDVIEHSLENSESFEELL